MTSQRDLGERAVRFAYDQEPAYGILHAPDPDAPRRDAGLIMINSAIRTRGGPHRLYIRYARRLAASGYHVLRYDPPGIGESPGMIQDALDYKRRFVDSLTGSRNSVDFLMEETGVTRAGFIGLCAGAYCALVAAQADPRVKFAILASLPVQEFGDMSEEALTSVAVSSYFFKAFQLRSWTRLITGKIDLGWALRASKQLFSGKYSAPGVDPALWGASKRFTESGRNILFVYGSNDWLYAAFRDVYWNQLQRLEGATEAHRVHVVQNADHIFARPHWQNELYETSISWLNDLPRQRH